MPEPQGTGMPVPCGSGMPVLLSSGMPEPTTTGKLLNHCLCMAVNHHLGILDTTTRLISIVSKPIFCFCFVWLS